MNQANEQTCVEDRPNNLIVLKRVALILIGLGLITAVIGVKVTEVLGVQLLSAAWGIVFSCAIVVIYALLINSEHNLRAETKRKEAPKAADFGTPMNNEPVSREEFLAESKRQLAELVAIQKRAMSRADIGLALSLIAIALLIGLHFGQG